jgi:hypothetical protein
MLQPSQPSHFALHVTNVGIGPKQAGLPYELHVGPSLNHFEVMDSISEPNGFFCESAIRLVGTTVRA